MADKLKLRKDAQKKVVMSDDRFGSDPVGEQIPSLGATERLTKTTDLLKALVKAQKQIEKIAPAVAKANEAYDAARDAIAAHMEDEELKTVKGKALGRTVTCSLASRTQVKVGDKPRFYTYIRRHAPDLLTMNHMTLQGWFKNDAKPAVREHPENLGLEIAETPQLQVRVN